MQLTRSPISGRQQECRSEEVRYEVLQNISTTTQTENMPYEVPQNKDPLQGTKYDFPRDHVGFGRRPPNPEWPNAAKIAVSFVINYEEGAEHTMQNRDVQSENML
ncbi:hypothetical protein B7463_g553, partial [Scytalidium lignicola]